MPTPINNTEASMVNKHLLSSTLSLLLAAQTQRPPLVPRNKPLLKAETNQLPLKVTTSQQLQRTVVATMVVFLKSELRTLL